MNLTSTRDTLQDILHSLESIPMSYAETYGHHGDTLFLLWNICLSVELLFLLGRRGSNFALLSTMATPTNAEGITRTEHVILITAIAVTFGTLLLLFIYKIAVIIITNKKRKQAPHQGNDSPQSVNNLQHHVVIIGSRRDLCHITVETLKPTDMEEDNEKE